MLLNYVKTLHKSFIQKKNFFQWLNIIFNKVDEDRREMVGPDRSCAEWLLRNGAFVKWNSMDLVTDYNCLPPENIKLRIIEVHASDASIMHYGFDHFKDCKHIKKVHFHQCYYLEDEALKGLTHLKDSLLYLQITKCFNITENGLQYLNSLVKLQDLHLEDLPYVKDKEKIINALRKNLPQCKIQFD